MSEDRASAPLPKWPFYLADIVLSGIAIFVLVRIGTIDTSWDAGLAAAALAAAAVAAWISIRPWLKEHETRAAAAESKDLKSSMEQIKDLQRVAGLITQANSQWQTVQEAASRTSAAATAIADRMKAETEDFMKFLQNTHDQERNTMRLEIEKLRRLEGEWLKTIVQILDHVFALNQAAERSGQSHLVTQLQQFQNACRDVARRVGLSPFIPNLSDPFTQQLHQVPEQGVTPPEGARIGQVLATGFTYQGQLLRRALVVVASTEPEAEPEPRPEPPMFADEEAASEISPSEPPLPVEETLPEPSAPEPSAAEGASEAPAGPVEEPLNDEVVESAPEAWPETPVFREENTSDEVFLESSPQSGAPAQPEPTKPKRRGENADAEKKSSAEPELPL